MSVPCRAAKRAIEQRTTLRASLHHVTWVGATWVVNLRMARAVSPGHPEAPPPSLQSSLGHQLDRAPCEKPQPANRSDRDRQEIPRVKQALAYGCQASNRRRFAVKRSVHFFDRKHRNPLLHIAYGRCLDNLRSDGSCPPAGHLSGLGFAHFLPKALQLGETLGKLPKRRHSFPSFFGFLPPRRWGNSELLIHPMFLCVKTADISSRASRVPGLLTPVCRH
jgi:hypothetical protein